MKNENRRRGLSWGGFLTIWAVFLLLTGATACVVLYQYLGVYEKTRPEAEMERLLAEYEATDWEAMAEETLPDYGSFEKLTTIYRNYYNAYVAGHVVSYREAKNLRSDERVVYELRAGGVPFCAVTLKTAEGHYAFGRHDWKLDEVSAQNVLDSLDRRMVEVNAPAGTAVYLNGIVLDSLQEVGTTEIPGLSDLEKQSDQVPVLVQYEAGPVFGDIKVTDGQGNVLNPEEETGNTVCYAILPESRSVKITAPESLRIRVNGAELRTTDAAVLDAGIFSGLESRIGGNVLQTAEYELSLYSTTLNIEAVNATGETVQPLAQADNCYLYVNSVKPREDELQAAEDYFTLFLNYSAKGTGYYDDLLKCTLQETELYTYIEDSRLGMIWASQTQTDFTELTIDHFERISEDCFSCVISYAGDMTAQSWYRQYSYDLTNRYQMVFIKEDGVWYAAAMEDLVR